MMMVFPSGDFHVRQTGRRTNLAPVHSYRCAGRSLCVAVLRSFGLVSSLVGPTARAFPLRSVIPLSAGRVNNSRRLTAALIFRSWVVPHDGHCQVGSRLSFAFTSPQLEHVLLEG